ncbi:MAG: hypothetical protein Q9167_004237 [Letrouitia subvulpina]
MIDRKNPARLQARYVWEPYHLACLHMQLEIADHTYLALQHPPKMASHMSTKAPKVIVPAHIPKPLPDHLRSALVSALLASSSIENIQIAMHDTCMETGWLDAIHQRAKYIIHNGEADTWGEVMVIMIKEILGKDEPQNAHRQSKGGAAKSNAIVRTPDKVVKSGVSAVRTALDKLIEVEKP